MSMKISKTLKFINKANIVHNNKFVYTKTEYIHSRTKVIITCPIHGDFERTPQVHLRGTGCSKCNFELWKSAFVVKARKKHADRYSYENSVYTAAEDKIIITCKEHGDFEQIASNHLTGAGCRKCVVQKLTFSTEQFIKRAIAVHADTYSYDKTQYIKAHAHVTITCKEHGDFSQLAYTHLNGAGCRRCAIAKNST